MKALTLILPVYNEEKILRQTVKTLQKILSQLDLSTTIVIANNGSTDLTETVAVSLTKEFNNVEYTSLRRKGRGFAIKETVLRYDSDFYMYIDTDLPVTSKDLISFINKLMTPGVDVVLVRRLGQRPLLRRLMTSCWKHTCALLFSTPFSDIQSGIKGFSNKVRRTIIPSLKETEYNFDTELIAVANSHNYAITEVPMHWIENRYKTRASKVKPLRDSRRALKSALSILFNHFQYRIKNISILFTTVIATSCFFLYLVYSYNIFRPIQGPPYETGEDRLLIYVLALAAIQVLLYLGIIKNQLNYKIKRSVTLFLFVLMLISTMVTKPIFSQDVYTLLHLAKATVETQVNPYTVKSNNFPQLETYRFLHTWKDLPLIQPPGTLAVYLLPAKVESIIVRLLLVRLIQLGALLLSLKVFLEVLAKSKVSNKDLITSFMIINPFLITQTIQEVHNDVFIMLLILLAFKAAQEKKHIASLGFLIWGSLFKYISVIIIPAILILFYNEKEKHISKIQLLIIATGVGGWLLAGFTFFNTKESFLGLLFQSTYIGLMESSPTALVITLVSGGNVPPTVLGLVTCTLLGIWYANKNQLASAFSIPLIIMPLLFSTWVMGWYFLWAYPLLLLIAPMPIILGLTILATLLLWGFPAVLLITIFLVISLAHILKLMQKGKGYIQHAN